MPNDNGTVTDQNVLDGSVVINDTLNSTVIAGHANLTPGNTLQGGTNGDYVAVVRRAQLPAFMKDDPDIWFFIIEAEFQASNIRSDHTKFSETVRALDTETIKHITDVLRNPPASNRYENLKKAILLRTSDSREKQIRKLLTNLQLEDRRPSQLLREMRGLAKDSVSEELLKQLWMDRLPNNVKPLLVIGSLNLDDLAEMADKVMDIIIGPNVMAINKSSNTCSTGEFNNRLNEAIITRLEDLTTRIEKLESRYQRGNSAYSGRSSSRGRSHTQQRPQSKNRSDSKERASGTCYFHWKHGAAAKRCQRPCNFNNQEN